MRHLILIIFLLVISSVPAFAVEPVEVVCKLAGWTTAATYTVTVHSLEAKVLLIARYREQDDVVVNLKVGTSRHTAVVGCGGGQVRWIDSKFQLHTPHETIVK